MERIIFGDNQFFGINHFSEEKARQQAMKFQDVSAILDVLQSALNAGVKGFMCTTHDTVGAIADDVRADPARWEGFHFYPGMPYAHKYANAVTELGYLGALKKFIPAGGMVDTLTREYRGERVLIVAHQVIVNCFRYLLERMDEEAILNIDRAGDVPNCGITEYRFDPSAGKQGKLVLVQTNFVAPLEQSGTPVTDKPDQPAAPKS